MLLQKPKKLNPSKWLVVVVLVIAFLAPLFGNKHASAAVFYKSTNGNCTAGDYKLTPPYDHGSTSYDCVGDLAAGEYTGAVNGHCPSGVSKATYKGFQLCLDGVNQNNSVFRDFSALKEDCQAQSQQLTKENCGIIKYIYIFTNALSAMVGIVIIAMLVFAGIEWSTAGSDPQRVNAARGKIVNAVLALIVFIFAFALLQWLIPGGLFK